jgi:hypothetical protein
MSETEIVFLHAMSSPILVPTSQLLSLHLYDGVSLFVNDILTVLSAVTKCGICFINIEKAFKRVEKCICIK